MKWIKPIRWIVDWLSERHHLTRLGLTPPTTLTPASGSVGFGYRPPPEPNRQRHHQNAAGPFYSVDECIACGAPEAAAPHLMAYYEDPSGSYAESGCYFRRQPETPQELNEAIAAMEVSCIENIRYAGTDPKILKRLRDSGCGHLCDALESDDTDVSVK